MHRVTLPALSIVLLIGSLCQGQSLADAARENRRQKPNGSTTAKVVTEDDFSGPADVTIHLVPGSTSTGNGSIVAPGRGKHTYLITNLDATRFINGGSCTL
jgi:hypothetical protein